MKFFWQKEKEPTVSYTFVGTNVGKCGVIAALHSDKNLRKAFQAQFGKLSFSDFGGGRMECTVTCKPRTEKSVRLAFAFFANRLQNDKPLSTYLVDTTARDLFYATLGMVVVRDDKLEHLPVNGARSFKRLQESQKDLALKVINHITATRKTATTP